MTRFLCIALLCACNAPRLDTRDTQAIARQAPAETAVPIDSARTVKQEVCTQSWSDSMRTATVARFRDYERPYAARRRLAWGDTSSPKLKYLTPGQLLIGLTAGTQFGEAALLARTVGGELTKFPKGSCDFGVIRVPRGTEVDALETLLRDTRVRYVTPNATGPVAM